VPSDIPPRLLTGLESAVERSESDPSAGDSIRRLLRAIRDVDGLAEPLDALVRDGLDGPPEDLAAAAAALLSRVGVDADADAGPSPVALLVEPDPSTSAAVRDCLGDAGYRVIGLQDGASILAAVERQEVALIVLDIFLPDRDGRDVVLELSNSGVPIIVLSPPHGGAGLARTECVALGASAFLHRDEVAARLPEELEQLRTGEPEASSLAARSDFTRAFESREDSATGAALALLAFGAVRDVSEASGPDVAERALQAVVERLAAGFDVEVLAGRWSTDQVLLLVEQKESATASAIRAILDGLAEDEGFDDIERMLLGSVTGAVVTAPPGVRLDDRVQEAGHVRLGLSTRGTRLAPEGTDPLARPRVMFVEDDPVTSHLVVHKLEHSGFEVQAYDNGDRAAEALDGDLDFDIAVFDINLPGQDGFQLVRKLRSVETGRRRPILILSGLESDRELVRGLELGADDYVLKPFSPLELTARIRRLISVGRGGGTGR